MKQTEEPQKIQLKAIHVYWKLYYLIQLSRILIPILFVVIFLLESRNYESTTFWGVFTLASIVLLTLAIVARPYRTIGNLVISDSRIFFEGKLVELANSDKVDLCLSKPMKHSFLARYFTFYQHGFGNYIQASTNTQTLIRVNFLLEKKTELKELKSLLARSEQTHKFNLVTHKFKQPTFPQWNSFKVKEDGL